jgi:hypothetical protein
MGMNWFKNRPKTKPAKTNRPRVALNLSDLQLQDESSTTETGEIGTPGDQPGTDAAGVADIPAEGGEETASGDGENDQTASETVSIASSTIETTDPLLTDPIIIALKQMPRNPFERSPYAQLVEQLKMAMEVTDEPVEKKSVTLLNAEFSATIQTARELVAVIDKRLFRKGEAFQDKTITEIKNEYVSLESDGGIFLLPKTGVNISIAEDGTYTVNDSFHKK